MNACARFLATKRDPKDLSDSDIAWCTSDLAAGIYSLCSRSEFMLGTSDDLNDHVRLEFEHPDKIMRRIGRLGSEDLAALKFGTKFYGSLYIGAAIIDDKKLSNACKNGRVTL